VETFFQREGFHTSVVSVEFVKIGFGVFPFQFPFDMLELLHIEPAESIQR